MKLRMRRTATLFAALTLTAAGIAIPAQAASAAPPKPPAPAAASNPRAIGDCPSSYACLWYYTNFTGARWQGQNSNPTISTSLRNLSESAYNNGQNCTVHWYRNANYGGARLNMARGAAIGNLYDIGWANDIESMNWC